MDATALAYPDAYFDQILVTGVLHHLSDEAVRGIVNEMKRVLRPEGRALVMEDIALEGRSTYLAHSYILPTRARISAAPTSTRPFSNRISP